MPVIINPFGFISDGVDPVWNSADKDSGITLSNGDLTATSASNNVGGVRSTTSVSSGKRYVELVANDTNSNSFRWNFGLATAAYLVSSSPGADDEAWVFEGNGDKFHGGSFTGYGPNIDASDVVMMAVDFVAGKVWWGVNGSWAGSGDPAAGTGEAYSGLTGPLYLLFGTASEFGTMQASLRPIASYTYAAPAGFGRGW